MLQVLSDAAHSLLEIYSYNMHFKLRTPSKWENEVNLYFSKKKYLEGREVNLSAFWDRGIFLHTLIEAWSKIDLDKFSNVLVFWALRRIALLLILGASLHKWIFFPQSSTHMAF